jgi:hypothetical protein
MYKYVTQCTSMLQLERSGREPSAQCKCYPLISLTLHLSFPRFPLAEPKSVAKNLDQKVSGKQKIYLGRKIGSCMLFRIQEWKIEKEKQGTINYFICQGKQNWYFMRLLWTQATFTLYRISCLPTQKPSRIRLLFTPQTMK